MLLFWNQQVELMISTQKMHKFVMNIQISKFKTNQDCKEGTFSVEYESWIIQN